MPPAQHRHFRITRRKHGGSASTPSLPHRGAGPYTGVWNEEKESSLFVVPSCHYGYVDCKWYLDIRLSDVAGTVMGFDSLDTAARHQPRFSAAVSVEQSPSDSNNPNDICDLLYLFKKGMPLHERQGSLQLDGRTSAATVVYPLVGIALTVSVEAIDCRGYSSNELRRLAKWPSYKDKGGFLRIQVCLANRKKTSGAGACGTVALRRTTKGRKADSATVAAESARSIVFVFCELLESCYIMAKGRDFTETTKVPQGVELNFVLGSHLVLPLFSVAITVHLRRVPELAILIIAFGSAILTVVTLTFLGWDFRVMGFFMLGRTLYALFVIMVARAFENVRRRVFASQVLPLLMYLSALSNSQRVQNLCAIRTERHICGYQKADSSVTAGSECCKTAACATQDAYSQMSI
ncbi:hypothetical protein EPH_0041070 [Eimeria praecox]|uniref:Uncharacterized protein n=1 Tax=Eimeria praecox TaxID=51316 RepID=U6GA13_9EIME|nr:hypothetical protein EPH_0041070 [Eimeria praecox]